MLDKEGLWVDRREMLRVKLKSLAAEAKIIRFEERRSRGELLGELWAHRVFIVRAEARATHVAYGLIRGHAYERIERPKSAPDWDKVKGMIERYGPVRRDAKKALREHVEALASPPPEALAILA